MKEQVKPNPKETKTQDAELLAESILENPKNAPETDFEDDYEMAQKMSRSSVDSEPEESLEPASR